MLYRLDFRIWSFEPDTFPDDLWVVEVGVKNKVKVKCEHVQIEIESKYIKMCRLKSKVDNNRAEAGTAQV